MRGNGTFAVDRRRLAIGRGIRVQLREGHLAISQRELDESTCVLAVEGELDLSSAPKLKWALADVLGAGCNRLVVDLSRVTSSTRPRSACSSAPTAI